MEETTSITDRAVVGAPPMAEDIATDDSFYYSAIEIAPLDVEFPQTKAIYCLV